MIGKPKRAAITVTCVLGLAGLTVGTDALAGLKYNGTTHVSGNTAYGTLGATRNSNDSVQYLSCSVTFNANNSSFSGSCAARDAEGDYIACYTSEPEFIELIKSMNGDSYLYFIRDASTSECTYMIVGNSSHHAPKTL